MGNGPRITDPNIDPDGGIPVVDVTVVRRLDRRVMTPDRIAELRVWGTNWDTETQDARHLDEGQAWEEMLDLIEWLQGRRRLPADPMSPARIAELRALGAGVEYDEERAAWAEMLDEIERLTTIGELRRIVVAVMDGNGAVGTAFLETDGRTPDLALTLWVERHGSELLALLER